MSGWTVVTRDNQRVGYVGRKGDGWCYRAGENTSESIKYPTMREACEALFDRIDGRTDRPSTSLTTPEVTPG